MILLSRLAGVALDSTTPEKSTMAFLLDVAEGCLIAASATQKPAAVWSRGSGVALAAMSAQDPVGDVPFAVIGRVVEEDEVGAVGRLDVGPSRSELLRGSSAAVPTLALHRSDACRAFVASGQLVAELAERRQAPPADSHRARARHAVALAHSLHPGPDRL